MPRKKSDKDQKSTGIKISKKAAAGKKGTTARTAKTRKARAETVKKNRADKGEVVISVPPVIEALSGARLGICFIDKSGSVEYFNRHFSDITGLQLEKGAGTEMERSIVRYLGERGDQFQALFEEARESGANKALEHIPVDTGKEERKYLDVNLLPQLDSDGVYSGMILVIEETIETRPKAGMSALLKELMQAAMQHDEIQDLLDNLSEIIKEFSHCSYVRMVVSDITGDRMIKAETGKEPGLWDTDTTPTSEDIRRIFEGDGSEAAVYRTDGGSVYLEDIGKAEEELGEAIKELVVNLRNSYGFRSLAFVPVRMDDKTTGFIQLANKKAGGVPLEAIEAVEIASDQLKILMDRMGLKEEVHRQRESLLRQMHERSAHLEALSERLKQEVSERKKRQEEMREQRDLAVKLSAIEDMGTAAQACIDTAIRLAGADCGALYVKDMQGGHLVMQCSQGLSDEFIAVASHYDKSSPNYELVMQMKPVYSTMESLESMIGDRYKIEGLKGAALIPIIYDNDVIGCLNIASHVFDEIPASTRNAVEMVAAQVGSAISRIQGRKALADSEERYRTLFTRSANPILISDFDGKYLDSNDAALAFLECTREELQAMHMRDTLPPYLDEQWFQQHRESWEQGGLVERDFYVWGKIKAMEMTYTPLQLGNSRMLISVGTDITERKKAEADLKKSEEKYRLHVNSVADVIFSFDPDLKILDVSPSVERLLGCTPEELVGRRFQELGLAEPETVMSAEGNIRNVLAGLQVGNTRYMVTAKDGTVKNVEMNSAPLYSGDRIVGVVAVARDVTEHMKVEEALADSEARYRSLVESSGAGIATVTIAGEISFVNDTLCKMTGYSREEVLGKPFIEFVYPEDRDNTIALFTEAATGKKQHHVQFRLVCKDGRAAWFYTNPTELVINGQTVGFSTILQDITESRAAEKALRRSEEKFRELADLLPQVVYESDREGLITYINQRGYEVFKYGPDEIVNKLKVTDVIVQEERKKAWDNYLGILNGEVSTGNEYTALRKDGSTFNTIVFSSPILKDGEAIGLRGMYTDISRIKQTENDLRESEEKYRSLVENAGEAIFIAQDGKIKFANQRSFEIVHYSKEELFSKQFIEIVHPDDREMVAERYAQRLRGEEIIPVYDLRLLDRDGSTKWTELRASRVQWEGRPATLNFMTDITERKQAEQALKESEVRYRLLAENSLDVIWTADMKGEVTYISPSVRYIVGRSSEEIMGIYRRGTLTPGVLGATEEDFDRFRKGIQALIKERSRTQSFEFALKHPDGFSSWVDVKMSIMRDRSGQAAGILGIVRDITQQKKMTERLVSADRLASLGEMAGGLAHEVNNPLTAVMGFAYLLQQNPNVPEDVKKDVDAIYREGKRAADVIKSFLLFSRGHKQEKQSVFINDILEGVIRLRRSQMTRENVEFISEMADDLPAVQGDVSQLQQAFLNIVMNAEFFMHKSHRGGHLTVNTAFIDDKIRVQITDDGPGIPADKLNRVFDPFYTTKDVGEGTGLGLSICHGIIKGHGGEIYVESTEGKGATFIIELPPNKQAQLL